MHHDTTMITDDNTSPTNIAGKSTDIRKSATIEYSHHPPEVIELDTRTPNLVELDSNSEDPVRREDLISMKLDDLDETLSPKPSMTSKVSKSLASREIRNLRSVNPAGHKENIKGTSGTRIRLPTLTNARSTYSQIRDAIQDELDEFFDQQYDELTPEQQVGTDLNDRFRSIRHRKGALITTSGDLSKVLRTKGFSQEIEELTNEVNEILAKGTSIRLSYPDPTRPKILGPNQPSEVPRRGILLCEEKVQEIASCPISPGGQHSKNFLNG